MLRFSKSLLSASSKITRKMTTPTNGPTSQKIEQRLRAKFPKITHLDIINESHMHAGGAGRESHFKLIVVSDDFDKMSIVDRHREINSLFKEELSQNPNQGGIHALSISAKTNTQWSKSNIVEDSPACLGGSKFDKKT